MGAATIVIITEQGMPLRIMQVSQHGTLRGGAEFHCLALTANLVRRGFPVELICGDDGTLAQAARDLGVPVHLVPLEFFAIYEHLRPERAIAWPTVERIAALLRDFRPDVVHSHLIPAHVHAALAALETDVPGIVYTEHNFAVPAFNVLLSRLSRARTIVPSQASFALHVQDGIPPGQLTVIPHGIDPGHLAVDAGLVAAARQELGLTAGPVIGTVARLSPEKALDTLLRATVALRDAFPSLTLLIAGDGPLDADLQRLAGELGIAGAVRFLGFRRDVEVVIRLMDVFVLPSRMENVGLVLLEAMAACVPVVATTVGAIPEYVADEVDGLLVPPDDPAALAGAIQRLLRETPAQRARFGTAGCEKVRARFTHDRMVAQTLRLYDALVPTP